MRLSGLLVLFFISSLMYDSASSEHAFCPALSLPNGLVKERARGKMAYFYCNKGFTRLGEKFSVCLESTGRWTHDVPLCIGRGCPSLGKIPDMDVTESYDGAMLKFRCPVGTKRKGPETITCDGQVWSDPAPFCERGVSMSCDFEEGLCGWAQDENDQFDWTRKSGLTRTRGTGPDGDHTTGSGHYMFIETSSPRKAGDVARLISPIYPATLKNMSFEFWYHMKGRGGSSSLGVYIKPESALLEDIDPEFYMEDFQGDDWIRGFIKIPNQVENFQIIIVGTRKGGFVSDIAIDDIKMSFSKPESTTPSSTTATAMSTTPALTTPTSTTRLITTPATSPTLATKKAETTTIATEKPHPSTMATEETETTTMATEETETTTMTTEETETTTMATKETETTTMATKKTTQTTLPETTNKSRRTRLPVFSKKMRIKLATQEGRNYFLDMILYNLDASVVSENDGD